MRNQDGTAIQTPDSIVLTERVRQALSAADADGKVLAVVAEALVMAAGAADRYAAFLTTLLDSLSVGVIACDETGRVIEMNRAMREVHGRPVTGPPPDDLPHLVPTFLHDTSMRPLAWDETPLIRALNGEHIIGLDLLVRFPERRTRIFTATAQPVTGRDGRRLGAVSVGHEVTAERHAERFRTCHHQVEHALRTSSSITEAAPGVLHAITAALGWPCAELFVVDEVSGELRAVGNHSAVGGEPAGFFGHTPVRGRGITGRVWASGDALWVSDITRYDHLATAYERERVEMCVRNGIRTVLAVPVRDGSTMLGVLTCYAHSREIHESLFTVLLDGVAAQIGVYVALRRAEELARQLSHSQNDFLDLVGHELRTPLTSITANATMLAEESAGLDDDQREMLATVARNADVLQRIVDTLLDLAALESGHHQLSPTRLDLVRLVTETVAHHRLSAAGTGVRLRTVLPRHLWLHGDADRLRQVLDDLLSNALKYSPAGGEVRVLLDSGDHEAELCVSDDGIGTPEPERGRVFDRFYRAGNVRHQGIPGSGLGLSRARTIVGLHGGTIALGPHDPTGTTVRARLPLRPA